MATDKIFKILYLPVQNQKTCFHIKVTFRLFIFTVRLQFCYREKDFSQKIALDGPDGIYLEKDFFGKKVNISRNLMIEI